MAKTKLLYLGIGIFVALFVLLFATDLLNYPLCSDRYPVHYWHKSKLITEEHIPCSNNEDCSIEKMQDFCSPGHPSLLKCAGARYYCGSEGYCIGCDCLWLLPTHWKVK